MNLKEYVYLIESVDVEKKLTELIEDLKTFMKEKNEEEAKETIKSIYRFISSNVLRIGNIANDRLIDKDIAAKLVKIIQMGDKLKVPVSPAVEERILISVKGETVESEEDDVAPKKVKKEKTEYDHDESFISFFLLVFSFFQLYVLL